MASVELATYTMLFCCAGVIDGSGGGEGMTLADAEGGGAGQNLLELSLPLIAWIRGV